MVKTWRCAKQKISPGAHLCHKVGGGVAERLQHRRGLGVEERHPVGHFVVHLVLDFQLKVQNAEKGS